MKDCVLVKLDLLRNLVEGEEMLSRGILFHNVVGFLCDAIETITAGQGLEGRGRLHQEA